MCLFSLLQSRNKGKYRDFVCTTIFLVLGDLAHSETQNITAT